MAVEVEIGYRRNESVEMVRSKYQGEDAKYLYLESGRYVKSRVVSMRQVSDEPIFEDDEE